MKISIILGTRPEIIKMSPIIRGLQRADLDFHILHTGQHYSYNMDKIFFEQLRLPEPRYKLNVGSGTHAEETGNMLIGIEKILAQEKPNVVLVEGDTNSVLSGALAAVKLGIHVGHVEAGLRSFDRTMPEEINRTLTDHASDLLFAPTETAKENLLSEGIDQKKIFVTGNTIVDAVNQNLELAKRDTYSKLGLAKDDFFLLTLHRQENVDNVERLKNLLEGLKLLVREFQKTIVYPIHPRTKKRLDDYNIRIDEPKIRIIEPLDYLSFLNLESKAGLVLTDSGGVQEEACILRVPCVTLRYNTERPETIDIGANMLAGTDPNSIVKIAGLMLGKTRDWKNPFGDGRSAERIIDVLKRVYG